MNAWPTTDEVRATFKASDRLAFNRWLTAHDAKVRAEALRAAAYDADEWGNEEGMHGGEWFPEEWAGQVAGWLDHRADRSEREAGA